MFIENYQNSYDSSIIEIMTTIMVNLHYRRNRQIQCASFWIWIAITELLSNSQLSAQHFYVPLQIHPSNIKFYPYTYTELDLLNEEGANKKKWLNIFNKVYFNCSQVNRAHPPITRNKHYNNQSCIASNIRISNAKSEKGLPGGYVCVRMLCTVFGGRRFMLFSFMFHIIFYMERNHIHKHSGLPSELLKTSFPYTQHNIQNECCPAPTKSSHIIERRVRLQFLVIFSMLWRWYSGMFGLSTAFRRLNGIHVCVMTTGIYVVKSPHNSSGNYIYTGYDFWYVSH